MKARFEVEPPAVKVITIDNMDYIFICANPKEVTTEDGTFIECDYNEIHVPSGSLDINEIENDLESYVSYSPNDILSDKERIIKLEKELKEQVDINSAQDETIIEIFETMMEG